MDEARSARLLFVHELTDGVADGGRIAVREVRDATRVAAVPGLGRRVAQQVAYKLGWLGYERDVAGPLMAARRAVLGERAGGPPRFLVRVDEFPHYRAWDDPERYGTERFERFHEIMKVAGVPYLLAVLPRVSREPLAPAGGARKGVGGVRQGVGGARRGVGGVRQGAAPRVRVGQADRDSPTPGVSGGLDRGSPAAGVPEDLDRGWRPLDEGERATLARLANEGVSMALHGLTHRTRFKSPRRHSELCGLSPGETAELLDTGLAELAAHGVCPEVFVPPFNRFDASQLEPLGERFRVVCGGPESIGRVGFQVTPQWRGETVYLPSYSPFYGHAAEVRTAVEHAVESAWSLWIPVVLHWGWEADAGWGELERLASALAPCAARWEDFIAAVARSREGDRHGAAGGPNRRPGRAPDPPAAPEPGARR